MLKLRQLRYVPPRDLDLGPMGWVRMRPGQVLEVPEEHAPAVHAMLPIPGLVSFFVLDDLEPEPPPIVAVEPEPATVAVEPVEVTNNTPTLIEWADADEELLEEPHEDA
ncbi:MAG: hypothetical protein KC656_14730 [Myxococcales bacterium]|nr:hypothetical protein [Myxococcales bacterium]